MENFLIAMRIYKKNILFRNSQIRQGGQNINVRLLWSIEQKKFVNSNYFTDLYIHSLNFYEILV